MLVCVFLVHFAHETAGAARTRLSLRPLLLRGPKVTQTSDASRRENAGAYSRGCLKTESANSSPTSRTSERKRAPIWDSQPQEEDLRKMSATEALLRDHAVSVPSPLAQLRTRPGRRTGG